MPVKRESKYFRNFLDLFEKSANNTIMKNLLHPLILFPLIVLLITIAASISIGVIDHDNGIPTWIGVLIITSVPHMFYMLIWVGHVETNIIKK